MPDHSQQPRPDALTRFGFADTEAAAREISDLLEGVFGPFQAETGLAWRLLDEEELSPKDMAAFFRFAAEAEDPLAVLGKDSTARARLNARMRTRWSMRRARTAQHRSCLSGVTWSSLSEVECQNVREGLLHLAAYEDAHVRRRQPPKNRTDTALENLAEIYARHTLFGRSHWDLPHSTRSRFVQFAVRMLSGHLPLTELEPDAIAKRWSRLKAAQRKGAADL